MDTLLNYFYYNNRFIIVDSINLIVFIFVIIFYFTYNRWKESIRKIIFKLIIIYCCFNAISVFNNFGIICVKKGNTSSEDKECWKNIRTLEGAVEMYNIDHSTMMEELDIDTLIKEKYYDSKDQQRVCCYKNFGKLSEYYIIYCSIHGNSLFQEDYSNKNEYFNKNKDEIERIKLVVQDNKDKKKAEKQLLKERFLPILILLTPIIVLFFPWIAHPTR